MTTPSLERMIEELEEKKWYIADVKTYFFPEDFVLDYYEITLTLAEKHDLSFEIEENILKAKNKFATMGKSFKDCVTEAWNRLC